MKQGAAGAMLAAAEGIVARAKGFGALVVVNDRADVARLAGAGGVHVGQEDLSPAAVRAVLGADAVVGLSTHDAEQRRLALEQPIDYLAVGPVFRTGTKATGYQPLGRDEVGRAAEQIAGAGAAGIELVAIGGITLDTARSVIEAGARSVAVISDLLVGGDPSARVRQFLRELDESN